MTRDRQRASWASAPRARLGALLGSSILGCILGVSCGGPGAFACDRDDQCISGGRQGRCEPSGYCSFPDPTCASGQRYAEHAGALGGTCLPPGVEASTGGDSTAGSGAPTTDSSDPVTGDAATAASATSVTTGAPGTTSGPGSDTEKPVTSGVLSAGTSSGGGEMTLASTGDTGLPPGDPYGECQADDECTYPGASCMFDTWAQTLCLPDCSGPMGSGECPAPIGGGAVPTCREYTTGEWGCLLDCDAGACPDDMFCSPSTIGPFCVW